MMAANVVLWLPHVRALLVVIQDRDAANKALQMLFLCLLEATVTASRTNNMLISACRARTSRCG